MEVLVFVDGIDAMTSKQVGQSAVKAWLGGEPRGVPAAWTPRAALSLKSAPAHTQMQARKAYPSGALRLNEQFVDMHLEMRGGKLGLDFTHFDETVAATGERLCVLGGLPPLACGLWQQVGPGLRIHFYETVAATGVQLCFGGDACHCWRVPRTVAASWASTLRTLTCPWRNRCAYKFLLGR